MIEESWLMPCVEDVRKRTKRLYPVMLDIGANKGDWTDLMKDDFACIVACEPDRRNLADLVIRFKGAKNVWIMPEAVGAEDGVATFHQRDGHAQSSLSEDHPFGHGTVEQSYEVTVRSLPGFIDYWADFVKVDIEGAEADLVYPTNVTCYLIECHGTFEKVLDRLPKEYAVYRVKHPHPMADPTHCWAYAVREVPDGLGNG